MTFDEFSCLLDDYIKFYNEGRIKKSPGWMSPNEYRKSLGLAAYVCPRKRPCPFFLAFEIAINRKNPNMGIWDSVTANAANASSWFAVVLVIVILVCCCTIGIVLFFSWRSYRQERSEWLIDESSRMLVEETLAKRQAEGRTDAEEIEFFSDKRAYRKYLEHIGADRRFSPSMAEYNAAMLRVKDMLETEDVPVKVKGQAK